MGNGLRFYTEENVYMELISDNEQNYSYWHQQCRGDHFSFKILQSISVEYNLYFDHFIFII